MKKTIPTTLSGMLFYIEEDAYTKLSTYLDSIKKHFASYADSAEIVADIENRIAEQFTENNNKDRIVTLTQVETLIASMGNAADFSEGENTQENKKERSTDTDTEPMKKKLFRNPDDVIIAGVASGLAAYFDIDPIVMRLIFVLITLFGGSGIIIYIILWLIIPTAKTSTDKLQMRGEKITLESVKEIAEEKINEIKSNPRAKSMFRKIITLPFLVIGRIWKTIIPIIRKLIGLFVVLGASFAIFMSLFFLVVTVFNIHSPYVDFPFMEFGHHFLIYALMLAGFIGFFIPSLFVLFLGIQIMTKKNVLHKAAAFSLLGVWCLAIIFGGAVAVRLAPEYQNFINTSPNYSETTSEFPLSDFTNINIANGNKVTLIEGPVFKVSATGSSKSIENLSMKVDNNTLSIDSDRHFKICIFCKESTPTISVTMPHVTSLTLANGSRVNSTGIHSDNVSLDLTNGSRANLVLDVKNITINQENASWTILSGKATTADFKLSNASDMNASEFIVENVTVHVQNGSIANIFAGLSLDATLQNGSNVTYGGNPVVKKSSKNGSRLEAENSRDDDRDEDDSL